MYQEDRNIMNFLNVMLGLLFLWLCGTIISSLGGINVFFPFNLMIGNEKSQIIRMTVVRCSAFSTIAVLIAFYILKIRAYSSLGVIYLFNNFLIAFGFFFFYAGNLNSNAYLPLIFLIFLSYVLRKEITLKGTNKKYFSPRTNF